MTRRPTGLEGAKAARLAASLPMWRRYIEYAERDGNSTEADVYRQVVREIEEHGTIGAATGVSLVRITAAFPKVSASQRDSMLKWAEATERALASDDSDQALDALTDTFLSEQERFRRDENPPH